METDLASAIAQVSALCRAILLARRLVTWVISWAWTDRFDRAELQQLRCRGCLVSQIDLDSVIDPAPVIGPASAIGRVLEIDPSLAVVLVWVSGPIWETAIGGPTTPSSTSDRSGLTLIAA